MLVTKNLGISYVTDEETGKRYPIPAGGADDGETTESAEETEESEDDDDVSDDDDDLAGNFLDGIEDEAVRQQLEPYVKKWDAGVTRRFQELHSQYQPYKELGDIEQIRQAQELYRLIDSNPQQVYEALADALGVNRQPQVSNGQQGQPDPSKQTTAQANGMTEQQYAQLPPQIQQQLQQQQRILETLAQSYISDQEAKRQQEEDAALDSYLSNLKAEFGDFDEDYVLSKMLSGMDGAKAVKAYQKAINASQPKRPQPTVLSGGGAVAQDNVNVGELSSQQIRELTAGLMAQANQESM